MKYRGEFGSGISKIWIFEIFAWVCALCFKIFQHTFHFYILNFIDFFWGYLWLAWKNGSANWIIIIIVDKFGEDGQVEVMFIPP